MKKILKTIFCMMLAASLVVSFTACDEKKKNDTSAEENEDEVKDSKNAEKGKTTSKKNDKEDADKTAKGFMDGLCDLDAETMAKYSDDEDVIYEKMGYSGNIKTFIKEEAKKEMSEEDLALMESIDFDKLIDDMVDTMTDEIKYEIVETKADEDKYIYTVKVEMPDWEAADALMKEKQNAMKPEEVFADVIADAQNMSEEELTAAITGRAMEYMLDIMEESMSEVDKVSNTFDIVVTNETKKWLVDTQELELPEMVDEGIMGNIVMN